LERRETSFLERTLKMPSVSHFSSSSRRLTLFLRVVKLVDLLDLLDRLLQIDDMDAVALAEDELAHLRVPAPGLMTEVNPGFQHGLHGYVDHSVNLSSNYSLI
jgi:hypothetical protein